MNKVIIPVITVILAISIGLSQDVYGPDDKPEKLELGGTGYNSDTGEFEITVLVQLPKDTLGVYTVDTTLELFKPDGIPIRAKVSNSVPEEGVAEGGNNHSVHKLPIQISYDPSEDGIEGQRVLVVITSELLDPNGNVVDQKGKKKWEDWFKSMR